jgi:hypothetical protein
MLWNFISASRGQKYGTLPYTYPSRMPPFQKKRRRPGQQPNKNELKVSRRQIEDQERAQAGTLQERFPTVRHLELQWRMETPWGAILENFKRPITLTEPLLLDAACLGGCSDGLFPIKSAVERIVQNAQEMHEGMGICQSGSGQDPNVPCGTKLFYRVDVSYE